MKIRAGIIGYGNLGKAVEEELLKNKRFKLVAIFSRRTITSKYNTLVEPYADFVHYKGKIDIMFMCGGSANDIEQQMPDVAKYFNLINSFDTHSKLAKLVAEIDKINKNYKTVSLTACGWDPGLFSIIRSLCFGVSTSKPITFWGKGISMGHSDAIRRVRGVDDAVQFTVPNKQAIIMAEKGLLDSETALHNRQCFVVAEPKFHSKIEDEIKNMPNYFKGQPTNVSFISQIKLLKLKKNMAHKGCIVCAFKLSKNKKAALKFSAKMSSNPMFTAKIMLRFAVSVMNYFKDNKFGAYLPIDISISSMFSQKERKFIVEHLC